MKTVCLWVRSIQILVCAAIANLLVVFLAVVNGSADMLSRMLMPRADCLSPSTFYGVILGLGIALLVIIAVVAVYVQRQVKQNRSSK